MNRNRERIAYLLDKYRKNLCSRSELEELARYLENKEGKKGLLEDMSHSFVSSMEGPEGIDDEVSTRIRQRLIQNTQPNAEPYRIKRNTGIWWRGLAASIVVIVLGWWLFGQVGTKSEMEWVSVKTTMGEQKRVELPDGSTIFVNGASEIQYPQRQSSMDYRVIKLKGEAFFDVVSDTARPFFVVAPNFSIRVLGTSFNVDTELEKSVTVHEGQVQVVTINETEVADNLDDLSNIWTSWVNIKEETLSPQKLNGGLMEEPRSNFVSLGPLEKAEIEDNNTLSKEGIPSTNNWMYKDLAYYDQPLELVVQQLERYYGTKIQVHPELTGCKVTIAANKKTLDETLNGLARLIKNGQVRSTNEIKQIVGTSCR